MVFMDFIRARALQGYVKHGVSSVHGGVGGSGCVPVYAVPIYRAGRHRLKYTGGVEALSLHFLHVGGFARVGFEVCPGFLDIVDGDGGLDKCFFCHNIQAFRQGRLYDINQLVLVGFVHCAEGFKGALLGVVGCASERVAVGANLSRLDIEAHNIIGAFIDGTRDKFHCGTSFLCLSLWLMVY